MKRGLIVLLLLVGVLFYLDYQQGHSFKVTSARRKAHAHETTDDIQIAVVYPDDGLYKGALLAAENINAAGGVLGRKIKLTYFRERHGDELSLARKIADDIEFIAVIGHKGSAVALPASVIYESRGILFFSVDATMPQVTQHGFSYVFRNSPDNDDFTTRALQYCAKANLLRAVVLNTRGAATENFTSLLIQHSAQSNVTIVGREMYQEGQEDVRAKIAHAQTSDFDVVFVVDDSPYSAANVVLQIRRMGVKTPIIGQHVLDSSEFVRSAGPPGEGVLVLSDFDNHSQKPGIRAFVREFVAMYHYLPETREAGGYQTVQILAQAIRRAGDDVPIDISSILRYSGSFEGLGGQVSYTPRGDLYGEDVFMKVVKDGKFQLQETLPEPKVN